MSDNDDIYNICADCLKWKECELKALCFKNSDTVDLLRKLQEYLGIRSFAEKCTKFEGGRLK